MTTSTVNRSPGSLGRTQLVWLAFTFSMTVFGAFFIFTGPQRIGGPKAAISAPLDQSLQPDAASAPWTQIVVHDSGLHFEDHEHIDRRHRAEGLEGNGYHFVIGNGTGRLEDGGIAMTRRWNEQRSGAHVAAPLDGGDSALEIADQHNRVSIGICLVGDGDDRAFTAAQIRALKNLVLRLQADFGIPDDAVLLHRDISDVKAPGRFFPSVDFDQFLDASRP